LKAYTFSFKALYLLWHNISREVWYQHFCEAFQPSVVSPLLPDLSFGVASGEEWSFLEFDIGDDEIYRATGKLKKGKTAGPDEGLSETIKCTSQFITPLLSELFNAIFACG